MGYSLTGDDDKEVDGYDDLEGASDAEFADGYNDNLFIEKDKVQNDSEDKISESDDSDKHHENDDNTEDWLNEGDFVTTESIDSLRGVEYNDNETSDNEGMDEI